jgi:uncharacterized protein YkwD
MMKPSPSLPAALRRHRLLPSFTPRFVPLTGLLALLASGCGGGGEPAQAAPAAAPAVQAAAATSTPATQTAALSAPASATPAAPAAVVSSTCSLPEFKATALARINALRAAGASCGSQGNFGPAPALAWNNQLVQAADAHSRDMATKNYFSHTSIDGRSLMTRIDATGYAWSRLGENIAASYPSVAAVVDAWVASPGHCANLMNPELKEFGLACVPSTVPGAYTNYWTMDLAAAR